MVISSGAIPKLYTPTKKSKSSGLSSLGKTPILGTIPKVKPTKFNTGLSQGKIKAPKPMGFNKYIGGIVK